MFLTKLKWPSKHKQLFQISLPVLVIIIILIVAWLLLYSPSVQFADKSRILNRGPLGDKAEALKRVDELTRLTDRAAKMEIVSALIDSGDINRCQKVEGTIIDGLDYYSVCRNNIIVKKIETEPDLSLCDYVDNNML